MGNDNTNNEARIGLSSLNAGLGIPTDAEKLANSMQFGADMVSKYSKVCSAFKQEGI